MKTFDVVGVDLKTNKVRLMAAGRDEKNAEAYVALAIMRRGTEEEFFAITRPGMYADGEMWQGSGIPEGEVQKAEFQLGPAGKGA